LLAKISDPEIRASYLRDLESLTRSELEKDMRKGAAGTERASPVADQDPEDRRITEEIQRAIGLKVRMMRSGPAAESGRLVIDFYSNQDLQEVFRRLVNQ